MAPKLSSDAMEKLVLEMSKGSAGATSGRRGGDAKNEVCPGVSQCECAIDVAADVDDDTGVPLDVVINGTSGDRMCMGAVVLARRVEVYGGLSDEVIALGATALLYTGPFWLSRDALSLSGSVCRERENMSGIPGVSTGLCRGPCRPICCTIPRVRWNEEVVWRDGEKGLRCDLYS